MRRLAVSVSIVAVWAAGTPAMSHAAGAAAGAPTQKHALLAEPEVIAWLANQRDGAMNWFRGRAGRLRP
ncbi:MAG: hypothetical protein ACT4P5_11825 [Armatimonadota bacterium]